MTRSRFYRVPALTGIFLMALSLGGCGSISSFMAGGMADLIPAWAGGLPADAPPRPGSPGYEAYVKQHETPQTTDVPGSNPAPSASANPVH